MMVGMGNQIGFNSTLVQLKEGRKGIQAWNKGCFNSTLVQLKAIPSSIPP